VPFNIEWGGRTTGNRASKWCADLEGAETFFLPAGTPTHPEMRDMWGQGCCFLQAGALMHKFASRSCNCRVSRGFGLMN